jgi:hypothetical protein
MTSLAPQRIHVFARGTDSAIWAKWYQDVWHGFDHFGAGPFVCEPISVSRKLNDLSVIGVDINHSLCHKHWNGTTWSDYENIGGKCKGVPTISKRANGTIDVFHIGQDDNLYHKSWDGSIWLPTPFSFHKLQPENFATKYIGNVINNMTTNVNGFIRSPSATSWDEDNVAVLAIGMDGRIYHGSWTSASGWSSPKSIFHFKRWNSSPKAISRGKGIIDLFCIGENSTLYHLSFASNKWSIAHTFPGTWVMDPEVISWGADRMDVFVVGFDSAMYHAKWDGRNWSGWEDLGGMCMTAPRAVCNTVGTLNVFTTGVNTGLFHKWCNKDGTWVADWEPLGGNVLGRVG